ncbi:hypothetical protein K2173_021495 [Erythroxylum novogranatense]|uniref:3,4-dihydroxy-2-butanone-4-phosphate synthase n=1 Tax=Erythroxylum novogranatense TaxID=1862640 RepID=A0AAV8TN31_9ROSI|nr:hypothetical protein K2173_021495 [Erythroxylum novogranatense]
MKQIEAAGRGVLVYLWGHEGRGIDLGHRLCAYNLQDDGHDAVEANEELGLPVDSREYCIGAQNLLFWEPNVFNVANTARSGGSYHEVDDE